MTISLKLSLEPHIVLPSIQVVQDGEHAQFSCTSNSTIEWTFNNGKLPNNTKVLTNNVVIVTGSNASNNGYYECTVKKENGERSLGRGLLSVRGKIFYIKIIVILKNVFQYVSKLAYL